MFIRRRRSFVLAIAAVGSVLIAPSARAGKIYWVQSFEDRIGRANLDGSAPQVFPLFVSDPIAIAVDPAGGKFYFIQSFDDKVLRADLDGTNVTPVLVPPQVFDPIAIAVDSVGGKIYCAQSFDDKIIRANLDGTASEPIVAPPVSLDPVAVAVDSIAGKIYWAENPGNRIRRADLNGSNAETVVDSIFVADAVSIAVDGGNGKLYWAERSGDRIRRADTGGFNLNVMTLLDAVFVSDPVSIALDLTNARIYWAEAANSRVRRADLTGAGVLTILPLLIDPLSISVDPTPSPTPSPGAVVWNSDPLSPERTTRSLRFRVQTPVTATGTPGQDAIKVTMIDLQHPIPANLPQNPPPNLTTFDRRLNGLCVDGSHAGHHCDTNAGCRLCAGGSNANRVCTTAGDCPDGTCPAGGTCSSLAACTAAGEMNGCARWVGKPGTFYEAQGPPVSGPYKAARLQCTPFYLNWIAETASGPITVVGAEITPSSEYSVQTYAASCKGAEAGCTDVSTAVTMYTRRSGDVETPFNPPATSAQPDVTDVAQLVNKFKNVAGALGKAIAQLQPNLPDPNTNINVLDILAVVDAVRGFAYSFSGPCPCPSLSTCGNTPCANPTVCVGLPLANGGGQGATCVKTCSGGDNDGDPCIDNTHCPGGTCGAGFCRDRCGRCTP